ncbi:hypothetical protein ABK905_12815 [Acerihabitans sp. KWT182]|uniref:Phage protein n=1 Tax=Acerihabitans sp. KWT182 TaxID=3157919 RepID=A0AAU7QEP8_9GAMM
MKDFVFLEKMKNDILRIYLEKGSAFNLNEIEMNPKRDLDESLDQMMGELSLTSKLLNEARTNNDELAKKSALLMIRAQAMSLSGFFEAICDDTENLAMLDTWLSFPEDYELPEHYNYPFK